VIYLDTSVVLATLFNEPRQPPDALWTSEATSSRLLEYEVIVRLNAVGRPAKALKLAQDFMADVKLVDLDAPALARALQPFPVPLRTLDAIHLSTVLFLQGRGLKLQLATYDKRLARAAKAVGVTLAPL
jgi:predicted nucleic acid-binding protein